jgi:uncharacterized membrane protein (DUF4010 family)
MPDLPNTLISLLAALGLGVLIGAVRQRQHPDTLAGLRTHGLAALLGAVAYTLGEPVFLVLLALIAGLVLISYWRESAHDIGLTGEVALMLTVLLGALSCRQPVLAVGLAVVTASLLYAKASLHRFAQQVLSEREVHDGLVLLASALVILPLLPDHPIGPYGSLNPATLWKLAVLMMAISALGHAALRIIGNRWGLAVAGFFAGYVSSTAAIAGFGQRVRDTPALLRPAVAAAMLSNLASLSLFVPVLLAVAPALLPKIAVELAAAAVVLLIGGLLGLRGNGAGAIAPTAEQRMFRVNQTLAFVAIIATVLVVSAAMNAWLGPRGALLAAVFAASVELHAAVATLGQLFQQGVLDDAQARWGLLGLLAASMLAKSGVAFASGGKAYGLRVATGLVTMVLAVTAVILLFPATSHS